MKSATKQTQSAPGPQHPTDIEAVVIRLLHGCMTLVLAVATVYLSQS